LGRHYYYRAFEQDHDVRSGYPFCLFLGCFLGEVWLLGYILDGVYGTWAWHAGRQTIGRSAPERQGPLRLALEAPILVEATIPPAGENCICKAQQLRDLFEVWMRRNGTNDDVGFVE
jgi:hypothetical protein